MAHEHDEAVDADIRQSRRLLLRYAAGGAGLLALSGSGVISLRHTIAKDGEDDDDNDDDNSGHGSDNSGHGNGHDDDDDNGGDDDDAVAVTGEIPEGSIQIAIVDDDVTGFSPGELTVDLGQVVTFVNTHHDPHTATGSGFDTEIMQPGQTATIVLDKPGRFAYACQIHPKMTGSIAVRDADGQIPESSQSSTASPVAATPDAHPATPTPEATAEPALTPVTSTSEPVTVTISNFAFDPLTIDISVGTTVTWINKDSVPHTVTALDASFDTGRLDQGQEGSITFETAGSVDYRCSFHPSMLGTVVVT